MVVQSRFNKAHNKGGSNNTLVSSAGSSLTIRRRERESTPLVSSPFQQQKSHKTSKRSTLRLRCEPPADWEVEVQQKEGTESNNEASIWELLKFTVPTMGIWLASPILSLVDATVVGSQSVVELAALTPGTVLVDYLVYVFTFLGIATTNILSVTVAERNGKRTESRLNDALTLASICG